MMSLENQVLENSPLIHRHSTMIKCDTIEMYRRHLSVFNALSETSYILANKANKIREIIPNWAHKIDPAKKYLCANTSKR